MLALHVVCCMLHCMLSVACCTKDALEPLLPSLSPSDTVSFFEPSPSPAESGSSKPKCSAEPTDEGEHGDGDSHGPGRPPQNTRSTHGSRRRTWRRVFDACDIRMHADGEFRTIGNGTQMGLLLATSSNGLNESKELRRKTIISSTCGASA